MKYISETYANILNCKLSLHWIILFQKILLWRSRHCFSPASRVILSVIVMWQDITARRQELHLYTICKDPIYTRVIPLFNAPMHSYSICSEQILSVAVAAARWHLPALWRQLLVGHWQTDSSDGGSRGDSRLPVFHRQTCRCFVCVGQLVPVNSSSAAPLLLNQILWWYHTLIYLKLFITLLWIQILVQYFRINWKYSTSNWQFSFGGECMYTLIKSECYSMPICVAVLDAGPFLYNASWSYYLNL